MGIRKNRFTEDTLVITRHLIEKSFKIKGFVGGIKKIFPKFEFGDIFLYYSCLNPLIIDILTTVTLIFLHQ